jgi:hypothetical protein
VRGAARITLPVLALLLLAAYRLIPGHRPCSMRRMAQKQGDET